jgi:hypothetical protein
VVSDLGRLYAKHNNATAIVYYVDFDGNRDSTYFEEDLEFADRQAEAHWIARKLCEGEL